jgi:hypothetical protein
MIPKTCTLLLLFQAKSAEPRQIFRHTPSQAFLGGLGVVTKSADDAATALMASILVALERWNSIDRRMLISALENCLALTKSSCTVPKSLIPELKVKSINLAQYDRTGGLEP